MKPKMTTSRQGQRPEPVDAVPCNLGPLERAKWALRRLERIAATAAADVRAAGIAAANLDLAHLGEADSRIARAAAARRVEDAAKFLADAEAAVAEQRAAVERIAARERAENTPTACEDRRRRNRAEAEGRKADKLHLAALQAAHGEARA